MPSDTEDYVRLAGALAHASSHEEGGDDEVSVAKMAAHGSGHESGGGDEIDVSDLTGVGHQYVSRGDHDGADFSHTTLIDDSDWHDMDLSPIVPAGAVLIHLRSIVQGDTENKKLRFRKNGNVYAITMSADETQVADVNLEGEHLVPCDANRVIEYYMNDVDASTVLILGWFI